MPTQTDLWNIKRRCLSWILNHKPITCNEINVHHIYFCYLPSDDNLNNESFALGLLLAIINHKPISAEIDNEPALLIFLATSKLLEKPLSEKVPLY